jgi:hypothetical protein
VTVDDVEVPPPEEHYVSAPRSERVKVALRAEHLRGEVESSLRERGQQPVMDAALSAAAASLLRRAMQQKPPGLLPTVAAARQYGFVGNVLGGSVIELRGPSRELWRRALARVPRNFPINRYGLASSSRGRSAAILFGNVEADIESFPRAVEPGVGIQLRGRLASRFSSASLFVTGPDGRVKSERASSADFSFPLGLSSAGVHQIELLGDGAMGPTVVLNVPVYVGVAEPSVDDVPAEGPLVEAEIAQRLFTLLNRARAGAELAELKWDPDLARASHAHAAELCRSGTLSHVSPTSGDFAERISKLGIVLRSSGENLVQAGSAEVGHVLLMDSPAHRANMLASHFTHVGVGVCLASEAEYTATLSFGQRPIAYEGPPGAEQIAGTIHELRAARGLRSPRLDPQLNTAATQIAEDLRSAAAPSAAAALPALRRVLGPNRPKLCVNVLSTFDLTDLATAEPVAAPGLDALGAASWFGGEGSARRLYVVLLTTGTDCAKPAGE